MVRNVELPAAFYGLDAGDKVKADLSASGLQDTDTGEDHIYRCAACGFDITSEGDRIGINESHEHTFANPEGYVFRLGCFRNAPGCLQIGAPTQEHTWFPGYAWLYVLCGHCTSHLGWHYRSAKSGAFFGLILDNLTRPP